VSVEREYTFEIETISGARLGVVLDDDGTAVIYDAVSGKLIRVMQDAGRDDLRQFGQIVGGSQLTRARVALLP
jgi:hypothetical protein